ncbi:hypothetical protein Q4F19_05015 [Sphingomonas sp. BIUV-7]|uniref:Uncharacterized protein n=1 Tax=Sphingomonas natans TaxID=3063330 RepID=A0ABT8Y604_9SPHN|nr:hypothetical protein [Sphingomonas sp. BIUV-7]MDO6413736.1 hypothetical protein [Sphingomonas sp. BIUV-7]
MSDSRRKAPFIGIAAYSDKPFKCREHRKERAAVRAALAREGEPPHHKQFGDPWLSDKDGKTYVADLPDLLRK